MTTDPLRARYVYVHIGKTGGTYLKDRVRHLPDDQRKRLLAPGQHQLTLPIALERFPRRLVVFAVRHPTDLFVSAFNSRKRMGRPRYNVEHTPAEAKAFAAFPTAEDLACALGSAVPARAQAAAEAMSAIHHVNRGLSHYLGDAATLAAARDRIGWILATESLDHDLRRFAEVTHIDVLPASDADSVARHSTPTEMREKLSDEAAEQLRGFWDAEYRLYDEAMRLRAELVEALR